MIEAQSVGFRYGTRTVLESVSLRLEEPGIVALCGPNGSGKSTLLHVLAGIYAPHSGRVLLDDREVLALRPEDRARRIAVVPQYAATGFDLTVEEYCALGRLHRATTLDRLLWRPPGPEDEAAIESALERLSLVQLRHRRLSRLSGGERARASVAVALSQGADHVLLDEPTAHLDPAFARDLLMILRSLAEQRMQVLIVLHDLTLAGLYADRVLLLSRGRLAASGTPEEVLREGTLQDIFSTPVRVIGHPETGRPVVLPGLE